MFSRFFIERPIFAAVVAILLCLAGLVSMAVLPVQQYPTITPVQVTVSATYPGADSKTLADSVAAPIEAQINGVDNMLYMISSSSAAGQLTLTVYFSLDTNPDIAQVQVQNRVNLAIPQLPTAVTQLGVSVQKKSSSIMMLIGIFAKGERYTSDYVANFANVYVLDAVKRVPGAGQAQVMGVADQAMRIWLNPDRMASLGITTSDIANAVKNQNALFGAGQIGQAPNAAPVELTFPVVTQAPFTDPRQYEQIILRASQDGNAIVRVGDVARAEVGLRQYIIDSKLNGAPTTFIAVYLQPGANGLTVSDGVRKTLAEMKSRFPEGMDFLVALDTNDFVKLSIEEVIHTLGEAVVLVVLIVYLFLQSFRTTVICTVAIFVSLITTLAGMLALGFSINLITLFGLVLAIGIVVDDAIVVTENVERNMHEFHLQPKEATIKAMSEIASSLVAVVLVMASVFVPAAFLPGTTGQLYKQFAVTIAVSVAISGFTALTLTPAMCALMLKHNPPPTRGPFAWFNRQIDRITRGFGHAVEWTIKQTVIALVLLAGFLYLIWHFFHVLPTSFVPNEDQGYVMTAIIMPEAASIDRTQAVAERVDAIFAKQPGVETRSMITGYSLIDQGYKTNAGTFFVTLKDFKERYGSLATAKEQNARAVLLGMYGEAQKIKEAVVLPVAPPAIPGIGATGGIEFWVQDTGSGDPAQLDQVTQEVIAKVRARPEI
ncbi:MAG TPA: efflux RND transporter permease subunit, partial [Casimicrobiaceae bacterium]|nr:efflux RND transporter permease subunit [Casimicrobiaceae bacterium]